MIDPEQAEIQRKHAEQQNNMAKDAARKQKEAQKAAAESASGHADSDNGAALFNMVDEDKSGDLTLDEFFQALRETGSPPENDEEMLELMDPDNNGLITLSEWTAAWTHLESSHFEQEEAERRCAAGDEQWCHDEGEDYSDEGEDVEGFDDTTIYDEVALDDEDDEAPEVITTSGSGEAEAL